MLRDVATADSFLPVIRTITTSTGGEVSPADELRIMGGLTVTFVDGPGVNGPRRIELDVYTAPATNFPASGMAIELGDPNLPGSAGATFIVLASMDGPTHIGTVSLIPKDALTASNTDFIAVELVDFDDSGNEVAVLATGTTEITASDPAFQASGDWTANGVAWEFGLAYDLAEGHRLVARWDKSGAGVIRPPGAWRYT